MRKGERATTVVFWRFPTRPDDQAARAREGEDADEARRGPWARAYAASNLAQVDSVELPADRTPQLPDGTRHATADRFLAALPGLDLRHGGTAAFYSPPGDFVQMPRFADFHDPDGYYGTLAHEATHWTGHASRLARDFPGRFGSAAYAGEELVAELGAAFTCASLGFSIEPRLDHARYVAHWLDILKSDTRAVLTAASKAQQAADWMAAAVAHQASEAA